MTDKPVVEDVRCASCKRLMFRAIRGVTTIEIKCSKCNEMNSVDLYSLTTKRVDPPPKK